MYSENDYKTGLFIITARTMFMLVVTPRVDLPAFPGHNCVVHRSILRRRRRVTARWDKVLISRTLYT